MYWFTVANSLSRKTNLPNKMELNKHKYHRNDLGVASGAYFEDLWRHKRVNIDQSEDSLVNLTNQQSDCENSNSGHEASHNIV